MKLKNYRTFWILASLYLLCIGGLNYMVFYIQQRIYHEREAKGMAQMIIGRIPYAFPTVWQMTAYVSGFLLFFPGLLMIISMTNEFSFKTHRQNVIDGWSRGGFISVKMMLAIIMSVISTIAVIITAAVFGSVEGSHAFSTDNFIYILYYFIQTISYIMAALFISVLVKRGALAIGIYFLYVAVIENVVSRILSYYFNDIGRYLPITSANNLIPAPVFESVQKQLSKPFNYPALLITALIYLACYFFFTDRKFKTDDL
jgi:ABC-type transport system involved in multi-copper enzyme maturation permease subunit